MLMQSCLTTAASVVDGIPSAAHLAVPADDPRDLALDEGLNAIEALACLLGLFEPDLPDAPQESPHAATERALPT